MNRRDSFLLELYRQAWETTRHSNKLLLSFTSVYALITAAGIAFLAQAEITSDTPVITLFLVFALLALFGLFVSLRVKSRANYWTHVQVALQKDVAIDLPSGPQSRRWPPRIDLMYVILYLIALVAFLVLAVLLVIDVFTVFETDGSLGDDRSGASTVQFAGAPVVRAGPPGTAWYDTACLDTFPQQFCDAVKDAEVADASEVSLDLVAIIPNNRELKWDGEAGKSDVLVVTWTSWDGYNDKAGEAMVLTQDVWVTVVPEVTDFCRRDGPIDNVALRLEQLLGLAPDSGKNRFVEMWAGPRDIFRPSPDPAISDHESEVDFPVSPLFVSVSHEHLDWINNLKSESYGENGLPWTRLGYTYDWGDPDSDIGLSEFVVRGGATVRVHSISGNSEYCRRSNR